jgi:hypothetical protein
MSGHTKQGLLVVIPAFVAALLALPAPGRGPTATLVGKVLDVSGTVAAGAMVDARNRATGAIRSAVTTAHGDFTIAKLPPGVYDITVSKDGFKRLRRDGVRLQAGQVARLILKLEVGRLVRLVARPSSAVC